MKRIRLLMMLMVLPMVTFSTTVVPLKILTHPETANGYFSWEEPDGQNIASYIVQVYEQFEGNSEKTLYQVKTKENFTKIPSDFMGRLNVFIKLEGVTEAGSIISIGDEGEPLCNECVQWETQCNYICKGRTYAWVIDLATDPSNSMTRLILKSAFNYNDATSGQTLYYYWYMSMDNYNNSFSNSLKSPDDLLYIPASSGTYYGNTGGQFTTGLLAGIPKRLGVWTPVDHQYAEIVGGPENCGTIGINQAINQINLQPIQDYRDNTDSTLEYLECVPAPGGSSGGGGGPDDFGDHAEVLTHYSVECGWTVYGDIEIEDYLDEDQDFGSSAWFWTPCDPLLDSSDTPYDNISNTYLQNVNDNMNLVWSSNGDIYLNDKGEPVGTTANILPGLYKFVIQFNDGSFYTEYCEIKETILNPVTHSNYTDITIFPVPLNLGEHYNIKIESEASLNIEYAVYTLNGELLSSRRIKVKKGDERIYKNFKIRNEWFPYNFLVHKFTFDDGSETIINTTVNNN